MARSKASSQRWRQRQERDPFVERAAREGWRSRAVFKLEELDRRERLLRKGSCCIDLGAAPGGWSQYAARMVGETGRVIAVDLLAMDPISGVELLQGDFTQAAVCSEIKLRLNDQQADLVISDMAPNLSGNSAIDQPRSMAMADEVLRFCDELLKPGGSLLIKLFQGEGFPEFVQLTRARFRKVRLVKPKASRSASREIYLLARLFGMV
jgi:23S rRNA (uridine2552-2'-O)-methyltransferase